jgi:hypothetical protein
MSESTEEMDYEEFADEEPAVAEEEPSACTEPVEATEEQTENAVEYDQGICGYFTLSGANTMLLLQERRRLKRSLW